jgi:ferredoxin
VPQASNTTTGFLEKARLNDLIEALHERGYTVVGPTIDQDAVVYNEIQSTDDLPRGWTDEQGPGTYRLKRRDDDAFFGYVVGPHSWKKFLFPPQSVVASAERTDKGWKFQSHTETVVPQYAFLGVRACELAAIQIQDQVFTGGAFTDPIYERRRKAACIIAVNCTMAAPTCFCTSMKTGPRCKTGFDMALTETPQGFVMESGSSRGTAIMDDLPLSKMTANQEQAANNARQNAVDQITRRLDTDGIRDLLMANLEHQQWDEVATRCLSCTNCTMVCPTCFCSTVEEVGDLTGDHVERKRSWDSCFNVDFSYMNGSIVRNDIRSRYRQWLTHKLATWNDQFGQSGCVGCGRCITWCPPGIDLTAEVAAIREKDGRAVLAQSAGEGDA